MSITQGGATSQGISASDVTGLGTAAPLDVGTGAGDIPQLDGSGKLLDSVLSGNVLIWDENFQIVVPFRELFTQAGFSAAQSTVAGQYGTSFGFTAGKGFNADASHNATYGGNQFFIGGYGGDGTASRAASNGGSIFFFGGRAGTNNGGGAGADGNVYLGTFHTGKVFIGSSGNKIGFFGQTPAAQPTMGAVTAGGTWTGTEQTMLQTLWDNLRALGLGT